MEFTPNDIATIRKYEEIIPKIVGAILKGHQIDGVIDKDDLWAAAHEALIRTYPVVKSRLCTMSEEHIAGYFGRAMKSRIKQEFQKISTVKRHFYSNSKLIERTAEELLSILGRQPTNDEIRQASGLTSSQYRSVLRNSNKIELEHLEYDANGEVAENYFPDDSQPNPFRVVRNADDIRQFRVTLKSLSELEQGLIQGIVIERKPKQDVYKNMHVSGGTGVKHFRSALIKLSDHILFQNKMHVSNIEALDEIEGEAWKMGADGFEVLKWGDEVSQHARKLENYSRYRERNREEINKKAAIREREKRARLRALREAA